jgi:hypothetical protein
MIPLGAFLNPSDRVLRPLDSFPKTKGCSTYREGSWRRLYFFPKNMRCVGSTDGWIAIDCLDVENHNKHKYLLHNEFSGTILSLTELDAAIGHVSELFEIRKVLLRSTPDEIIVIMTNRRTCPIILTRIGNLGREKKSLGQPHIASSRHGG